MRYRIISFGCGWHVQVKRFGLFWTYVVKELHPDVVERLTFWTAEQAQDWITKDVVGRMQRIVG